MIPYGTCTCDFQGLSLSETPFHKNHTLSYLKTNNEYGQGPLHATTCPFGFYALNDFPVLFVLVLSQGYGSAANVVTKVARECQIL